MNRNKYSIKNYNKSDVESSSFAQILVFSTPFSTEFNKIKNIVLNYLLVLSNDPIYAEILSKGVKTVLQ